MVTWKDGQVVWVQPEDIQVEDEGQEPHAAPAQTAQDRKQFARARERGKVGGVSAPSRTSE